MIPATRAKALCHILRIDIRELFVHVINDIAKGWVKEAKMQKVGYEFYLGMNPVSTYEDD